VRAATWPSWPKPLRCGLETKIEHCSASPSVEGGTRRDTGQVALAALSARLMIEENGPGYEGILFGLKRRVVAMAVWPLCGDEVR
jgi:hypothetical protein